jgi:hypothetical protein
MARSSRRTGAGAGEGAMAPQAADGPQAADSPAKTRPVAATRTKLSTQTAKAAPSYMAPPQGGGAPTRLRYDGAPQSVERLNVTMKILLDPAARTRPGRVYSGQARNWSR